MYVSMHTHCRQPYELNERTSIQDVLRMVVQDSYRRFKCMNTRASRDADYYAIHFGDESLASRSLLNSKRGSAIEEV
jgi:hypothetical protein